MTRPWWSAPPAALVAALARSLSSLAGGIAATLPEVLTALAFVGGWTLVTVGVVALTSPLAWLFSGGLLSISLGGWRLFYIFVRDGLYVLTGQAKRDRG